MRKLLSVLPLAVFAVAPCFAQQVVTGKAAFADFSKQKPGVTRRITVADLPEPNSAEAVNNGAHIVRRPQSAWPVAPAGFKVTLYAGGDAAPMQRADKTQATVQPDRGTTFREPRLIRSAPNGDLFLADSQAGNVMVLRGVGPDGRAQTISKFASGLSHPFGINFYPAADPKWVYVANTYTVVRYPYHAGDLVASGPAETIISDLPGYAQLTGGGHWTRDVVFSPDGRRMFISVGSGSNVDNPDTSAREFHRADVLVYSPEGKFQKVYANGIRNCVGEAINPSTGELWCSTNERDDLGNNLVPDYITSVKEDGFYGWPWYYMGGHRDPRLELPCRQGSAVNHQANEQDAAAGRSCQHVDIAAKVLTPDVLVQPHMASLEMTFYPASGVRSPFPAEYNGFAFAAEHGSWNREPRTGYEVVAVPMRNGHAEGTYTDFLTGFVTSSGEVWGRPVGVTVGQDGSLYVTDDGSRSVWRVTWVGSGASAGARASGNAGRSGAAKVGAR